MLSGSRLLLRAPIVSLTQTCSRWDGAIPHQRIKIDFQRGSTPGGTHADTTSTRAEVRFSVADADWLPDDVRDRFAQKYAHRINNGGEFIVRSQRTRESRLNLADCLDKIRFSVREIEAQLAEENKQPDPDEVERLKKRHAQLNRARLREKKQASLTKASRSNNIQV